MQSPELTQFAVGVEALEGGGEFDEGEGEPEVFAEGGGDGLFAEEGELFEGGVVLEGGAVSWGERGGRRSGKGKGKVRLESGLGSRRFGLFGCCGR